jgi:hypothetical protein
MSEVLKRYLTSSKPLMHRALRGLSEVLRFFEKIIFSKFANSLIYLFRAMLYE